MAALTSFEPKDVEHIISLPLKLGVWVGAAEDESGETDDQKERHALLAALKSVTRDKNRPQLVRDIAEEALKHQAKWQGWHATDTFKMPDPVPTVKIVMAHAGKPDARAYRIMLYDVAEAVALAYGEFGLLDDKKAGSTMVSEFFDKLIHRVRSETEQGAPQNVSPAEQDALNALKDALKLGE